MASRRIGGMTSVKKHANEIALANDLAERTKSEEGYQYQECDKACRYQLIERAPTDVGYGIGNTPVMNDSHRDLFKHVEDEQKREKNQRFIERWPNQGHALEAFANMEHASYQNEFGADQSLDGGEAKWRVSNILRVQDCAFQICQSGKADIEIRGDDGKFPQFDNGSGAEGFFCWRIVRHCCSQPHGGYCINGGADVRVRE
jgi:hypothetical protein